MQRESGSQHSYLISSNKTTTTATITITKRKTIMKKEIAVTKTKLNWNLTKSEEFFFKIETKFNQLKSILQNNIKTHTQMENKMKIINRIALGKMCGKKNITKKLNW